MSKKIFEGLGAGTLIPQRGKLPIDDPKVGAEEGFVLSRVDGHTSLEEICLLVPFDEPVTMVILRRLWEIGAIEVPGVARILPRSSPVEPPKREPPIDSSGSNAGQISPEVQKRIDQFYDSLDTRNAFELLEIERTADVRDVKRAYFKLSKEFHPDRYFGRDLGDTREKLSKIFQAIKAAFELLSDKDRRAAYEESAGLK
jgi:hypothetical protein